ncbi:hypothetical protein [Pseudonocardia sp. WMMC193]|uniref:hypothetical protein n=1 Tax=Pseudonocardia sp. WMMC193 TaxID=2911965 RepID=UPI001F298BCC|nr:hypothetical protein [Pseudonocardia sp. WMMC193]MCF7550984.1 hypothetical protein [Pseudonocardia sp. WMMC193]
MRLQRYPMEIVELHPGDRVEFRDEPRRVWWTVRAVSTGGRWVVLTVPFNVRRTVLYTVIDFVSGVRGPDDYGGLGYEDDEQIAAALARFEEGDAEVSVRYDVRLDIAAVRCPHRSVSEPES